MVDSRAMEKTRNSRWDYRATVKTQSNKHGNLRNMHPQVRRQVEAWDDDIVRCPKPKKYKKHVCHVLKGDHDMEIVNESSFKWYKEEEVMYSRKCRGCGFKDYLWKKVDKVKKV